MILKKFKFKKYIVLFFIAFTGTGCAISVNPITNSDMMKDIIDEAARELAEKSSASIKKDSLVSIFDLNTKTLLNIHSDMNILFEEKVIEKILESGIRPFERGRNISKKKLDNIKKREDYIIAYRMLKAGISNNPSPNPLYVFRQAVIKLKYRIIEQATGEILYIGTIDRKIENELDKRLIEKAENTDWRFDGYDIEELKSDESTDLVSSAAGQLKTAAFQGINLGINTGLGFAEWSDSSMITCLKLGYPLASRIALQAGVLYLPYTLEEELLYENKYYESSFEGQVIPIFLNVEFRLYKLSRVSPVISSGLGTYIYLGEVAVPEVVGNDKSRITSFSGSEISYGYNAGFGIKADLYDGFEFTADMKYHYTGYDYGKEFQVFSAGLNYTF
ncbi:hypothetical protein ACFLR5_00900 [Elusimicrobiota bacterium]